MTLVFDNIILFVVAYFVSLIALTLLLKQSKKYKLQKVNVTGIRFRSQSKPVSGGIAFFIVFILAGVYLAYFLNSDNTLMNSKVFAFAGALIIAFFFGLLDDIINTSPYVKFASQILIAFIIIKSGIIINLFGNETYNIIFTGVWIVGVMNSINMLDNMDGVSTIASIGTLLGMGMINYYTHNFSTEHFFITVAIAMLVAFLFYNWPESKMYMGDNGSQFIGALLAIYSIVFLWNPNINLVDGLSFKPFIVVFLSFLIPFSDTFTVSVNRISKGKSPFQGGRDHTTHYLFYLGLSEKSIVSLFLVITVIFNILAALFTLNILSLYHPFSILLLLLSILYLIFVFANTHFTKQQ